MNNITFMLKEELTKSQYNTLPLTAYDNQTKYVSLCYGDREGQK